MLRLLCDPNKKRFLHKAIPALHSLRKELKEFDSLIAKAAADVVQQSARAAGEAVHSKEKQRLQALQATKDELLAQREVVCAAVLPLLTPAAPKPKSKQSYLAHTRIKRDVFRLKHRLPALAKRAEIEQALRNNQFLVIQGSTGSGKSTQLPQYLAEMPQFDGKMVRPSSQPSSHPASGAPY